MESDNKESSGSRGIPPSLTDESSKETCRGNPIDVQQSLSEITKTMDVLINRDPLKGLRESMQKMYVDPLQNLSKRIKEIYIRPLENLRSSINAMYIEPIENLRRNMRALYIEPLEDLRQTVKTLYLEPLEDIRKSMQALYTKPIEDLRKSIQTLCIEPFEELRKSLKAINIENPIGALRNTLLKYHQITDSYKIVFSSSQPANTFEEAFQTVLAAFLSAQTSGTGDAVESAVQVVEQINHKAKTFPLSKLSLEFYLNVIISLIFFLYSMYLSEQSEIRITESLHKTEAIVVERLLEFRGLEDRTVYYFVQRPVNLRTKPTTKSASLSVLCPNQKVRLVEGKGKWIKVEVYNHILDTHEVGWCFKKYLKRIK